MNKELSVDTIIDDINHTIENLNNLKSHALKTNNTNIINWCENELYSYDPKDVPKYRQINSNDWQIEMSGKTIENYEIVNRFTITILRKLVNDLRENNKDGYDAAFILMDDISKRILRLSIGLHQFKGYDNKMLAINDDKVLEELTKNTHVQDYRGSAPATLGQFVIDDKIKIFKRVLDAINEKIVFNNNLINEEIIAMKNKQEKENNSNNLTIVGKNVNLKNLNMNSGKIETKNKTNIKITILKISVPLIIILISLKYFNII